MNKPTCRTCHKTIEGNYHNWTRTIDAKTGKETENSAVCDNGFCMLPDSLTSYKARSEQVEHEQK